MPTLLFDNYLSPRLPQLLAATFPGGVHVRAVGLAESDDLAVWSYAQARGHAIVTKGEDFRQLAAPRARGRAPRDPACLELPT